MPIVYDIKASYRRTVQPKDYESATAEVGLKAQLEEGDDLDAVVAEIMETCRHLTLQAVTGKALGKSDVTIEISIAEKQGRAISDTPEDRGEQEEADASDALQLAEKKALAAEKRKAVAAKKKLEAMEALVETLPADEDYDASAFDEVDTAPVAVAIISANDLQNFITGSVADKLITVTSAKEVMLELGDGAGRTKDVPDASRNAVHERLQEVIAATKAKKAKK